MHQRNAASKQSGGVLGWLLVWLAGIALLAYLAVMLQWPKTAETLQTSVADATSTLAPSLGLTPDSVMLDGRDVIIQGSLTSRQKTAARETFLEVPGVRRVQFASEINALGTSSIAPLPTAPASYAADTDATDVDQNNNDTTNSDTANNGEDAADNAIDEEGDVAAGNAGDGDSTGDADAADVDTGDIGNEGVDAPNTTDDSEIAHDTPEPGTKEPNTGERDAGEPETVEPDTTKNNATESDTAVATGSDTQTTELANTDTTTNTAEPEQTTSSKAETPETATDNVGASTDTTPSEPSNADTSSDTENVTPEDTNDTTTESATTDPDASESDESQASTTENTEQSSGLVTNESSQPATGNISADLSAALNDIDTAAISFEFSSATLTDESKFELNRLKTALETFPEGNLIITGHTDSVGSDEANQAISQGRANAVKNYLVEQGIAAERLNAIGFGETRPIATNETSEGRKQNRRIELDY